jgi:hypothetical protein
VTLIYGFWERLAFVFESGIKNKRFKQISDPYHLAVALDNVIESFLLLWLEEPERLSVSGEPRPHFGHSPTWTDGYDLAGFPTEFAHDFLEVLDANGTEGLRTHYMEEGFGGPDRPVAPVWM